MRIPRHLSLNQILNEYFNRIRICDSAKIGLIRALSHLWILPIPCDQEFYDPSRIHSNCFVDTYCEEFQTSDLTNEQAGQEDWR